MAQTLNWGIIGCGDVTEVKSGPAFNKVPNSALYAVMRRDAQKAADYAQRHNVPKWFSDADALINDPNVNAIYVATPPSSHLQYALAAIKAGKPVYVEKPVAMNQHECLQMAEASERSGVRLCVAHYRRQLPVFKKIQALLNDKIIGEPKLVNLTLLQAAKKNMVAQTQTNWRVDPLVSGGGLFHDLAPHQLDLMFYFFGNAAKVHGMALNQAKLYNAPDLVSGCIVFKNKVLLNGLWCFSVPDEEVKDVCEIIGTAGKISFSVFSGSLEVAVNGNVQHYSFPYPAHVQQPMIEKVTAYFLGGDFNPCTAREAAVVMHWMDTMTAG